MSCQCASAITAEMVDWVNLGGANSGCCGNSAHTYGFHCAANRVPVKDYSRRHEGPRPYDMNWGCAGDFSHRNKPHLRAKHAVVLARLMRGELPMICEFIGSPWPGKGVYYWARWNGATVLQRYTGTGHDHWSHISWWRSKANQRAYLWVPQHKPAPTPPGPKPAPAKPAAKVPAFPGRVLTLNPAYDANLKVWQTQMRKRGWKITADGRFGPQTRTLVMAFQKEKRLGVDGKIGPITWRAAWTANVT